MPIDIFNFINKSMLITPQAHSMLLKKISSYLSNPNDFDVKKELDNNISDVNGNISIIPIYGIIGKNVGEIGELVGMIDADSIYDCINDAATDPMVKYIVLDIASAGGETTMVEEIGRRIVEIDTTIKPIYAFTSDQMDSAAYWIGSQARKIGMINSAQIGGVGVYILISNETKKLEQEGIKIEAISSGKYKLLGHEWRSLTDEEREILQIDVNNQHDKFRTVIKSRRPSIKDENLEGLSYGGEDALKFGFVDIVCDNLEEFIAHIMINE
jgi:signal peptide peptidase SppA